MKKIFLISFIILSSSSIASAAPTVSPLRFNSLDKDGVACEIKRCGTDEVFHYDLFNLRCDDVNVSLASSLCLFLPVNTVIHMYYDQIKPEFIKYIYKNRPYMGIRFHLREVEEE
jgi:hypothetical protein